MTHQNVVTTAVKKTLKTNDCDGIEGEEILKKDLESNAMLCPHNSFCRNKGTNVDPLLCWKQRVEEQRCWTSKRRKPKERNKGRSNKGEKTKTQYCFCARKTQMRDNATRFRVNP